MFSDAFPPARNQQQSNQTRLLPIFGLAGVLLVLGLLSACSTGNSAAMPSNVVSGQSTPQADSTIRFVGASGTLPDAVEGTNYNTTLTVSGGSAPYDFAISWGQLPTGLKIGKNSGTISGIPSEAGTYSFGVHVSGASEQGTAQAFEITVGDASTVKVSVTPPTASLSSNGTEQFSALVTNSSNSSVTWSASTGTISKSGMYTAPTVTKTTTVTVTATSSAEASSKGTATVTITAVTGSPLSVTTSSLSNATSGTSYSSTLAATGGKAPYSWSVSSGTLPSGMTLQSTGTLSGTTTETGAYTFTAEVKDSSSPEQTATKSLSLTVSASTAGGTKISLSFFGADYNGYNPWPGTTAQNQAATLGGIRLWDDGLKWSQLETSNGVYDWTELDTWLGDAEAQGEDVLYTFGATPEFAAATTPPKGCNSPSAWACAPPTDVNSDGTGTDAMFQAFVTALVTHAAGRISFYELWNEPDCTCFWAGTEAQLVRMGADAAAIIRSLDPAAQILSPSAHGPTMATWFDGYIAAGGAPNFDIVNVHMRGTQTTNKTPEAFLTVYGQVETELEKRNLTSLPLWDDEHGINSGQGLTDPTELAGYAARGLLLRAGVGLQRQYIYTWDSTAPYGFQNNESGTAWNVVAGWLIGHSISACTAVGTVYTCNLDYGQAVWDTSQSCSNGVCTTSNYKYPANSGYQWYHNISGDRTALSGDTVPIGYQPILLESQ